MVCSFSCAVDAMEMTIKWLIYLLASKIQFKKMQNRRSFLCVTSFGTLGHQILNFLCLSLYISSKTRVQTIIIDHLNICPYLRNQSHYPLGLNDQFHDFCTTRDATYSWPILSRNLAVRVRLLFKLN